jgi:hypothetical protein
MNSPDEFFKNPQHERTKLFLSQILHARRVPELLPLNRAGLPEHGCGVMELQGPVTTSASTTESLRLPHSAQDPS